MTVRIKPDVYRKNDWVIHDMVGDFTLIDCWELPVELGAASFVQFFDCFINTDPAAASWLTKLLFKTRFLIGKIFRFDDDGSWLPIPGTEELSISGRLGDQHEEANLVPTLEVPATGSGEFRPVYLFNREALIEISNKTVYALIHIGETAQRRVLLGIYIKSRGLLTDVYMGLIKPFRHYLVYPSWLKHLDKQWVLTAREKGS